MTREEAARTVKAGLKDYLRTLGINPDKQFRCLNPEHEDKHPSMGIALGKKDGLPRAHCFACGAKYSTFDLIGMQYGLTTDSEIFRKAYEVFNLKVEGRYEPVRGKKNTGQTIDTKETIKHNTQYTIQNDYTIDITQEAEAAHKELMKNKKALAYLEGRGLSRDIINEYKIGYVAGGYNSVFKAYPEHQTKSKKAGLYRLMFPYWNDEGKCGYALFEIADRRQVDEYNGKYRKINKGETGLNAQLFNERYLKDAPPVCFLCEGMYDALSVEMAGGKAIAFIGTAHVRFLTLCKKYMPTNTTFIISLDADTSGQSANERVKEGLDALGIRNRICVPEGGKDFNEALQKDKDAFFSYISGIIESVDQEERAAEEEERSAYLDTSAGAHLLDLYNDIRASQDAPFFSTGFPSIDTALDGGLYPGLHIIGAISSLGKTTLALQIMDNIAASGNDVLFFSLEMARTELMSKSISRLTMLYSSELYNTTQYAKTLHGIMNGTRYKSYSQKDKEVIDAAMIAYSNYAQHVYIREGMGDIGVMDIRRAVEKHIRLTGNVPIVCVDYLQILAPYNDRVSDKQNTDRAVLELKRTSRDYSLPVIAISSFNRESYTEPVTMAAFKESGGVEYGCDVLIGLQYNGTDYIKGEKQDARRHRVRDLLDEQIAKGKKGEAQDIQFKILKNRSAPKEDVLLQFYPMFNRFAEIETEKKEEEAKLDIPY